MEIPIRPIQLRSIGAIGEPGPLPPVSEIANTSKLSSEQPFLAQIIKILAGTQTASIKIFSSGETIQVDTANKLQAGQLVLLTPDKTSEQGSIKLQTDIKQSAEQIFRLLMPKQGSTKQALTALAQTLAQRPKAQADHLSKNTPIATATKSPGAQVPGAQVESAKSKNISQEVNRLVSNVISQLPSRQEITKPTLLKEHIRNSGLFTLPEVNKSSAPAADPRAAKSSPLGQALLPILKLLLQTPSLQKNNVQQEQSSRLADALARVILSQIRPLNLAEGGESEMRRSEFVVRGDNQLDEFQIQFTPPDNKAKKEALKDENEETEAAAPEKKWTVRLSFDFPELGKITAFIILSANKQVEMNFWSERPATFMLINKHSKNLQRRLQKRMTSQGIGNVKIEVFEGKAPARQTIITSQLINEIA